MCLLQIQILDQCWSKSELSQNDVHTPFTFLFPKGQLISKANWQAVNSSKKQTNEFVFTSMRRVLVRFLEKIEDSKKAFRNHLTFSVIVI